MKINELSKRHIVFMYDDVFEGIYLNFHVINAKHRMYIIDTGNGSKHMDDVREYFGPIDKPIIVINTHSHWDHVWGNGSIESEWIVAHQKCYERLVAEWDEDYKNNHHHQCGDVVKALPNLLFDDSLTFADDGIVLGTALGHSDNDIYVYDQVERILNAGDNIGDCDEYPVPSLTTTTEVYAKTLDCYQAIDFDYVVSGHNEVKTKDYLDVIRKALNKMK